LGAGKDIKGRKGEKRGGGEKRQAIPSQIVQCIVDESKTQGEKKRCRKLKKAFRKKSLMLYVGGLQKEQIEFGARERKKGKERERREGGAVESEVSTLGPAVVKVEIVRKKIREEGRESTKIRHCKKEIIKSSKCSDQANREKNLASVNRKKKGEMEGMGEKAQGENGYEEKKENSTFPPQETL